MIQRSLREKKEESLIITRPSAELLEQGHVVSFTIRYDHRLGILTVHLRNIYGIPFNNPSSIYYVKSKFWLSSMSSIFSAYLLPDKSKAAKRKATCARDGSLISQFKYHVTETELALRVLHISLWRSSILTKRRCIAEVLNACLSNMYDFF